jgi:predicted transcriptional regulator
MKNFKNIDWLNDRATVVPLSWLQAGLTGAEWDVGIYLLSVTTAKTDPKKNDVAGTCRASQETIAERLGRNKMAIGRDVRSLIKKGCITKVYQGSGKSKMSNVYKILDDLQDNELVVYKAEQDNELVVYKAEQAIQDNELVSNRQPTGSQQTTNSYSIDNELVVPSVSSSESSTEYLSMSLEQEGQDLVVLPPTDTPKTVLSKGVIDESTSCSPASDGVVNSVESIAKLESYLGSRDFILMDVVKLGYVTEEAAIDVNYGESLKTLKPLPDSLLYGLEYHRIAVA